MSIELKLGTFEGPLDLLLHLIEQSEIDLYEISIAEVTKQYMTALAEMQRLELDVASEFIVMAATLLAMKSKRLLPKPEPDVFQPMFDMEEAEIDDPREALILRLVEYKRFKVLAQTLKEHEKERAKVFSRAPSDLQSFISGETSPSVKDVSVYQLAEAFQSVLERTQPSHTAAYVQREVMSVGDRVEWLRKQLGQKERVHFSALFESMPTRQALVVTFMALLELMKKNEIICEQNRQFTDILIRTDPQREWAR